MSEIQL